MHFVCGNTLWREDSPYALPKSPETQTVTALSGKKNHVDLGDMWKEVMGTFKSADVGKKKTKHFNGIIALPGLEANVAAVLELAFTW